MKVICNFQFDFNNEADLRLYRAARGAAQKLVDASGADIEADPALGAWIGILKRGNTLTGELVEAMKAWAVSAKSAMINISERARRDLVADAIVSIERLAKELSVEVVDHEPWRNMAA